MPGRERCDAVFVLPGSPFSMDCWLAPGHTGWHQQESTAHNGLDFRVEWEPEPTNEEDDDGDTSAP